jgi:hypothetical protein
VTASSFFSAFELQDALLLLRRSGPATLELALIGMPGATYAIESSTDLIAKTGWTVMKSATLTNSLLIVEGIPIADQAMFFRASKR